MKFKISVFIIILTIILSAVNLSFADYDRLVDIPVPPDSSGYADFTEEEAAENAREYEENKNNIVTTTNEIIGKSADNYLKSLEVQGYDLNPKFNRQQDTYTIYVKDENVNNFNITAEPENENAKIEGTGNITVSKEQRVINIKVTAENGDLKVYTINIENESNKQNGNTNIKIIIGLAVIIIVIVFSLVILKNRKK